MLAPWGSWALTKKTVTIIACVVLTAVGVYFALPRRGIPRVDPDDYRRPWVCDACGHVFQEPPGEGLLTCPKCGEKQAAQSAVYTCKKCGKEFEAYRFADFYSADGGLGPDGKPAVPTTYYKKAGGRWTVRRDDLGPVTCPDCGNKNPATLEEKVFAP